MSAFVARPSAAGSRPSRRDWLRVGLPAAIASLAAGPARPRADSVVVLFAGGGPSQFETFDPKPDAPAEVRGAFASTPTAVPGVRVCEHLPLLAARADRFTLVRSMTHDDVDHGSACYLTLTGRHHPIKSSNPPPRPTDHPALGAALQRVRPADRLPHAAFHVNGPLLVPLEPAPGLGGGFLGRGYDPIRIDDPTVEPDAVAPDRRAARRALAAELDSLGPRAAALPGGHRELVRKAYDLLDSPRARDALDLSREPAAVRDRYGRHRTGQSCLLARRLVEAGVPWVTVFLSRSVRGQDDHPADADAYGWDTHNDIFAAMRDHLLPRLDQSVSAFLDDLGERGLLSRTLVVLVGEFGRAPLVAVEKSFKGDAPGRKHWARCYSALLAGAGVRRGAVHGSSDRRGAFPQADPVTPGDLAATLFHALGVPADAEFRDHAGRPYPLVEGRPVAGLFG